ncbi:solute carrier family 35 member G1 isoform X2 [Dromiciops gliroides]|uniref:solute carrier family 35 member G1 isoform X1 n=1 Tax=Dromiciops gliroides TaxID=33562 RepID=UPI001CC63FDD|nr:solute carrier family 35 member G1 isoform X1 [Dromiciops gliroides]XP_043845900.1 solute carrier family 35 member G1 isoform X2 [Dromiciops gliroides]
MSGGGAVTAEPQEPELREPALQEPELREPALQEPELREPALQAPEEERLQLSGRQEEEAAAVAVEPDPDPNPDPNPAPAPQLPAPGGCCPCAIPNENAETKKKASCPGLGLFYALLSAFFFSVASLLVKKIQDIHSTEISAFRCVFQMLFILPFLMYKKTGFVGPKGKRIFLLFRGIFGSTAMILLYYAFQLMPIADATVITFTTPVFTSLFACIYLKEKYSFWDLLFTLFAIAGVLLIARPPFLFGSNTAEIEDDHSHHLKGALAAVGSALCGALTLVILRKVGKSVHYLLSIWYYLVIGLLECVIALFVLGEWRLPHCGLDRLYLILIALLGLGGQIFITRALQIEKAGPVSIMKTMDVVFAFILQIIFLHKIPTWWTIGGALCVVTSSSGAVIRNWYNNSKVSHQS